MLRLDRAIPHMKGLSEYFPNITSSKPSILSGNHGKYGYHLYNPHAHPGPDLLDPVPLQEFRKLL